LRRPIYLGQESSASFTVQLSYDQARDRSVGDIVIPPQAPRLPLVLVSLALLTGRATAGDLSGREIYQQTVRATAWVSTARGTGTGWLLDRDRRLLVTCYHVVAEEDRAEVIFPVYRDGKLVTERSYYKENRDSLRESGHLVAGRVVQRDKGCDLALIELPSLPDGVAALSLAADSPAPGESVHAVGNRRDLDALWVYTAGAARQVYRLSEGYPWQGTVLAKGARVVLAQLPINEGDSGGPVVNDRGELVAVAAAVRWQSQLASVCIDVSEVRAFTRPREQRSPSPAPPASGKGAAVYRQALHAVAWVKTTATDSRCSGWLLDRDRRLLLTTCQAAGSRDVIEAIFPVYDQGKLIAEAGYYHDNLPLLRRNCNAVCGCVLVRDIRRDLALVELDEVPEGAAALRLAMDSPSPGERLHAVENRHDAEALWLYVPGAVRQVARLPLSRATDQPAPAVLVAQLPPHGEDGGAPVIDDDGQVVGMTCDREAAEQMASCGPDVSEIRAFVAEARPLWEPRTAADYRRRAALYVRTRRFRHALADCTAALRLDPQAAALYGERAEVYRLQGDLKRAISDCEQALRLDPKLAVAYCSRGAAFRDKGDLERAVADYTEALRLDPKYARAYSHRGDTYRRQGDLERALADCNRALEIDPNLAPAYYHRALVYTAKKDRERAILDYTRAIEFDPLLAAAYRGRGDAYRLTNDPNAAQADYAEARELDAFTPEYRGQ
jgi:tetratricopeptide (TPR) repeat protein/S1-C subfamily serine protease